MAASLSLKKADNVGPTPEEIVARDDFSTGPFSLLYHSVKDHDKVLVSLRSNHKLLGRVKAFDRHMNLVMEDVREFWTEFPKKGKGKKKGMATNKERLLLKLFVRGDSIILIIRNPKM